MKKRVAVIFAGGKSSRMGRDKSLLPFGECLSLAEYQYRRLSLLFDKVYISAKENKFDFEVEVIEDCYSTSSPLVALVSVFETLDIEEIFVLSVDAPFVNVEVIEKLYYEADNQSSYIVAESPNGLEPLCGIYRRSLFLEAKKALLEENHRLVSLLNRVEGERVKIGEHYPFMNLNHREEYEEALRIERG